MRKEIDQLEYSTAVEIYTWLVPVSQKVDFDIKEIMKLSRNYLRNKRLSPYDGLELVRKQKASAPKHLF
jgi:hypothetical protein